MTQETYDAIVIGGGPAGLSAAVSVGRARRSALVIDRDQPGRSDYPQINHNYLGFPEGIAARDLCARGRAQAERFGAVIVDGEARSVRRSDDGFIVEGDDFAVHGRGLILATGVRDVWPLFPGHEEFIGHSLHWCIVCDGYEMEGQRVIVAGNDDAAGETALQLRRLSHSVTLVTNSGAIGLTPERLDALDRRSIPVIAGRIIGAIARERGMFAAIRLDDGREIPVDHLFSQQGSDPQTALARSLGAALDASGFLSVDTEGRTSLPNLYAAGDCTRLFSHQVSTAVHEGATAAGALVYDLWTIDEAI
jgi:thioredoxin reductase (NADPH)